MPVLFNSQLCQDSICNQIRRLNLARAVEIRWASCRRIKKNSCCFISSDWLKVKKWSGLEAFTMPEIKKLCSFFLKNDEQFLFLMEIFIFMMGKRDSVFGQMMRMRRKIEDEQRALDTIDCFTIEKHFFSCCKTAVLFHLCVR